MFFVTVHGDVPSQDRYFGPMLYRSDANAWIAEHFPHCPCTVGTLLPPVGGRTRRTLHRRDGKR